jgi:hypothetical protein
VEPVNKGQAAGGTGIVIRHDDGLPEKEGAPSFFCLPDRLIFVDQRSHFTNESLR